jgi:hypothetical protein
VCGGATAWGLAVEDVAIDPRGAQLRARLSWLRNQRARAGVQVVRSVGVLVYRLPDGD